MRRKPFGKTDLEISPLGFGSSLLSGGYGERDDDRSLETIHAAIACGLNFFDTADAYGNGHSETLLAKALKEHDGNFVVGTKFGNLRGDDGAYSGVDGRPEKVAEYCDGSLKRLDREVLDLYYLHRIDPNVPIEDTVGAMARLVEAGKVRYLGLCEAGADTLRRAHAVHPITALQTEYSLWTRDVEAATLPTCRELGIALVAYAPLGRGFLTGAIKSDSDFNSNDRRPNFPRFSGENLARNLELLAPLEAMAGEKGVSTSEIALAWVLAQGDEVTPIFGTMNRKHLDANVAALNVELSADEIKTLEKVFAPGAATGNRYPDKRMHLVSA
ncbi:MAG TPA: aldo/keto reductase [Rhodospirillaceae bacterium]|nr:aldo/keto reductase [Rhodospirillaceae bacterium]HAA91399.1 aldo/keto reductase [Rhodospirillaceae bacterium]HAT35581.1 aldo/keto reductase [Rhodospirillaceae bacterium]